MDAAAYLQKLGWQGSGHSLQPSKPSALKKPLLVSKKIDVLGLGVDKHAAVSDQWWMRAFDASLKDFGSGNKSVLNSVQQHGVARGGLYGRFVKGEGVAGTIGEIAFKQEPVKDQTVSEPVVTTHQATSAPQTEPIVPATHPTSEETDTVVEAKPVKMGVKRKADATVSDRAKRLRLAGTHNPAVGQMTEDGKVIDAATGKVMSYKAAKYAREKAKREAKREIKETRFASTVPRAPGETDEEHQVKVRQAKREKEAEEKALKQTKAKSKAVKKEEKRQKVLEKREAKRERKAERRVKKLEVEAILAEQDREAAAARLAANGGAVAETNGDVDMDGTLETNSDFVALTGPKERTGKYPTKGEKRLKKLRAQAIVRGMTLSQIKKEDSRRQDTALLVEREHVDKYRANKVGLDLETYRSLPVRDYDRQRDLLKKLDKLDDEKKAQYLERAQAKKQHIAVYFMARTLKNEEALREKRAAKKGESAEEPTTNGHTNGDNTEHLGFVIDTTGAPPSAHMTSDQIIALVKAAKAMPPAEFIAKVDTSRFKGAQVKDLPKPERKLRTEWMRAKRRLKEERAIAEGRAPKAGKNKKGADGLNRAERKMKRQENLMLDILRFSRQTKFGEGGHRDEESGQVWGVSKQPVGPNNEPFPVLNVESKKGMFTKQEEKLGRRTARRLLRHEKQMKKRGPKEERGGSRKGKMLANSRKGGQKAPATGANASIAE